MADATAPAPSPADEAQKVIDELVHMQAVADKAFNAMRLSEADFRGKKKEHEKLVEQVQLAVRQAGQGVPASLFDPGRPAIALDPAKLDAAKAKMTAAAAGVKEPGAADAWKATPIEALGLSPKITEALKCHQPGGKSANLHTLGGLCEFQSADGRFSDVKGIAKAGVQKVEDAVMAYFQANPIPVEPAAAAAPLDLTPTTGPAAEAAIAEADAASLGQPKGKGKKKAKAK